MGDYLLKKDGRGTFSGVRRAGHPISDYTDGTLEGGNPVASTSTTRPA